MSGIHLRITSAHGTTHLKCRLQGCGYVQRWGPEKMVTCRSRPSVAKTPGRRPRHRSARSPRPAACRLGRRWCRAPGSPGPNTAPAAMPFATEPLAWPCSETHPPKQSPPWNKKTDFCPTLPCLHVRVLKAQQNLRPRDLFSTPLGWCTRQRDLRACLILATP